MKLQMAIYKVQNKYEERWCVSAAVNEGVKYMFLLCPSTQQPEMVKGHVRVNALL